MVKIFAEKTKKCVCVLHLTKDNVNSCVDR